MSAWATLMHTNKYDAAVLFSVHVKYFRVCATPHQMELRTYGIKLDSCATLAFVAREINEITTCRYVPLRCTIIRIFTMPPGLSKRRAWT
jgi:hypothetical protein